MTTADAYGELAELMQLVDEYYQVELLDPSKMPLLQQQIWDLIRRAHLARRPEIPDADKATTATPTNGTTP